MAKKTKRPAKAAETATESKAVKAEIIAEAASIVPSDKASKKEKEGHKKQKMVRDSFTMPMSDYAHIAAIKNRCLKAGVSAKKSEVLRAALHRLSNLSDSTLTKAIADLKIIKTGRPTKT